MQDESGAEDAQPSGVDTHAPGAVASSPRRFLRGLWASGRLSPRAHLVVGFVLPALALVASMLSLRALTIDDSYISYRYAQNLASGLGLVYNAGERIEGYTNFLWTLLLALGVRAHASPDVVAKLLGAFSAVGALGMTYLLSARLRPLGRAPVLSTWLFATSSVLGGYAVFGLETLLFIFLVLAGAEVMLGEDDARAAYADRREGPPRRGSHLPLSGLVFALAGLTRPEAPLYIGIFMLFLGRRFLGRQNLLRGALFVLPLTAHLLWRHSYYGAWLPNTLSAKTGSLEQQVQGGLAYLNNYAIWCGPLLWLAPAGLLFGLVARRRVTLAVATVAFAVLAYVVLVGGDWMPYFRFLAPFEPFCFLLICAAIRDVLERERASATAGMLVVLAGACVQRGAAMEKARSAFAGEDRFWKATSGAVVAWLTEHDVPGGVALGDIGYVGYATGYPVLDLLGLVDPVISELPGGYTRKVGPGYTDRFFDKAPRYAVLISGNDRCTKPTVPTSQVLYHDPRFSQRYGLAKPVVLKGGGAWCIFEQKSTK